MRAGANSWNKSALYAASPLSVWPFTSELTFLGFILIGLWGLNKIPLIKWHDMGFPVGASGKEPPANAGDLRNAASVPGSGRSPGRGHGNPLQYSCLENPMDRGAWQSTVHRVAKSQTRLNDRACTFQSVAFPRLTETLTPASWHPLLRDLGSRPTGPLLWAAEFW